MKLEIGILLLIFLSFIASIQAQPGCATPPFNIFDNYYYGDVDYVIYGSGIDTENLKEWANLKGENLRFSISRTKLKIKVIEELKGNLNEKQIEVYIGYDCRFEVGGTAIYKLKKAYLGDSLVWVANQVSYPMNGYSEKGREEALKKVKTDLTSDNENNLSGVIVEKLDDDFSYTVSDEVKRKLGYNPRNFKPMTGIAVEAKRKTDNKIFRTITDDEGNFRFTDLADGDYQVYPIVPTFYKTVGFNNYENDKHAKVSTSVHIQKNWAYPRNIFKLETFGNLKGKIENMSPEFQKAKFNIWRVINNGEKIEYQQFMGYYLPLKSESIITSESSIDFNFTDFPTGKYILAIQHVRTAYFPGTIDQEKAEIFEVKRGETTNISFKVVD